MQIYLLRRRSNVHAYMTKSAKRSELSTEEQKIEEHREG